MLQQLKALSMRFSRRIVSLFLLSFATLVVAEDFANPDYLDRSNKVLTNSIKKLNESSSDYEAETDALIDDALKASNVQQGRLYNSENRQQAKQAIKQYLQNLNVGEPENQCDGSTNLTECEMAKFKDMPKNQVYIHISSTMPDGLVLQAMEQSSKHNGLVIINGLIPGKNILETARYFSTSRNAVKSPPQVSIDPRPFRQFKVTSVPAVTVVTPTGHVTVPGTLDIEYAKRILTEGSTGLQNKAASTYPIVEKDFVLDLQERFKKLDIRELAKKGVNGIWKHQNYINLPTANKTETIDFDPTFIVAQDVSLPDGRLIAKQGSSFNPLHAMPLSKTYLLFDATNQDQIDFVKAYVKDAYKSGKNISVMATKLPADTNWDKFHNIRNSIGGGLFLANQDIVSRFRVSALPATVSGKDGRLIRTQHSMQK